MALSNPKSFILPDYDTELEDIGTKNINEFWYSDVRASDQRNSTFINDLFLSDAADNGYGYGANVLSAPLDTSSDVWGIYGHGDYQLGSTLSEMSQLEKDLSTAPTVMETYSMAGALPFQIIDSVETPAETLLTSASDPPSFSVEEESELKRQLLKTHKSTRSSTASELMTCSESSKEKPTAIRKRGLSDDAKSQRVSPGGKKSSQELMKQMDPAAKVHGKLNDKTAGTNSASSSRPPPKKAAPRTVKLGSLPDALQGASGDPKKVENLSSRKSFSRLRPGKKELRRTAQMIDPLPRPPPVKVGKTGAVKINKPSSSNEPKKSAELGPPTPELPTVIGANKLVDHDYCSAKPKRKASTETVKQQAGVKSKLHKSGSLREVAMKRSGAKKSSKSISTAEYLKMNKIGIRSAPVTPHQSPKPTRGSKRAPNYMIESKKVSDEISKIKLSQMVQAVSSKVSEMANPPAVAKPEPLTKKSNLKPDSNLNSLNKYIQQVVEVKSGNRSAGSLHITMPKYQPSYCKIKEASGKVHTVAVNPSFNRDPRLRKPQKIESTVSLPNSPFDDGVGKTMVINNSIQTGNFKRLVRPDGFKMKASPGGKDSAKVLKVVPSSNGVPDQGRAVTLISNPEVKDKIYSMKNSTTGSKRMVSVTEIIKMQTNNSTSITRTSSAQVMPQRTVLHNGRSISTTQTRKWQPIPNPLTLLGEIQRTHQFQPRNSQTVAPTSAATAPLAPNKTPCRVVMPQNFRKINGSSYSVVNGPGTTNKTLQILLPTTSGAQGKIKSAQSIHPTLSNTQRMVKVLTSKNNPAARNNGCYITTPQVNGSPVRLLRNVSSGSPVNSTTQGVRVVTIPISSRQQVCSSLSTSTQPIMIRSNISQNAEQSRGLNPAVVTSVTSSPGNKVLLTNAGIGGSLQQVITSPGDLSSSSSPVSEKFDTPIVNDLLDIDLDPTIESIQPKSVNDQDADQYFSHGRTSTSTASTHRRVSPLLTNEDVFMAQAPIRKQRPMKFNINQRVPGDISGASFQPTSSTPRYSSMRSDEPPQIATGAGADYLNDRLIEVMERGRTTVKAGPSSVATSAHSSRQGSRSSSSDSSDATTSGPSSRDSSVESNQSARFQRPSPTYSSYDGSRSPSRSPRTRRRASFRNYRTGRQSNNLSSESEYSRRGCKRMHDDGDNDGEREVIKRRRRNEEAAKKEREIKAVGDRRVVFVGGLLPDTTDSYLYARFGKFGKIENIKMKRRNQRDREVFLSDYAFIYFENKQDANRAIEEGNKGEEVEFQLSFGGRRQFCKSEYSDLDNVKDDMPVLRVNDDGDQLQELLRQHQKEQERNL